MIRLHHRLDVFCILILLISSFIKLAAEMPDLSSVPADLTVPPMVNEPAAAGKRVRQVTQGWENTSAHHTLYLPTDWKPGTSYPVLVEYAGNGGYRNKFGDTSEGTVDGSNLGYGISAGKGFLWVCLPYIEIKGGKKGNVSQWWGDVAETKRYCLATVQAICRNYGGNPDALILCGFSRGSIACNYLGLHDDEIAKQWRAFICYSHYDGVITTWPYADADRISALTRLQRLGNRPQFICMENSVEPIRDYLKQTGVTGNFTFTTIPFRNHHDAWILRDIPERRQLREWVQQVLAMPSQ